MLGHKGGTVLSRKPTGAEWRPALFGELGPGAARRCAHTLQAETPLAGTSCSAPAELSTARGGGAPRSQCAGAQSAPGYTPLPEHTLQSSLPGWCWQRSRGLRGLRTKPSVPSLNHRGALEKPTNWWENLERKSSWVSALPHPQVTPQPELESRNVLGAIWKQMQPLQGYKTWCYFPRDFICQCHH